MITISAIVYTFWHTDLEIWGIVMFWVNFLQKCHVIWILDTSQSIVGLEFLKYCNVLGWFFFLQKCHVIWTPTSQSDCWPGVLLAGNQLTDTGGDSDNDVNVNGHWKSVQFFFHSSKKLFRKSLSPVEMFGEISGDCRQMGIYLVSHISILPSQPSPPKLILCQHSA